ncbi:MAG: hypothetical protein F4Z01_01290 [Gammaproteobacteria bacterium]|nr:hypothetical protein [Gammaproteobacteria bacterium]MYF37263.1 hypothetical protein [Gammaproteobacteria bacterium]
MNTPLARILLLVAGVLIGIGSFLGIKFILDDDSATVPQERTEQAQETEQESSTEGGNDIRGSRGINEVPTKVDQLVFPKLSFERKATIVSWVSTLTDDEIVNWLDQSTASSWIVSLDNRTDLQTTLLQKLSSSAPDRAMDFALARDDQRQAYSMANTVLQTWANTDLERAVARVKELEEQARYYCLNSLLNVRDDLPLEQMRKIAIELGDERSAFYMYFQNLTKDDIENPRDTWWEILDIANRESMQSAAGISLSIVAASWVEDSGLDVLDELVSSISNDSEYVSILPQILRGVSLNHPEEVFDYLISNLGDQATEIIQNSNIPSVWARKNPKGMIEKANTLPASRFRQAFVRNAVWRWAVNNPSQLLEQLAVVPPGERERASSRAIQELTKNSPTEAAEYVMQVEDEELRLQLAQSFIQSWAYTDLETAKEWVLSLPVAEPMRASLVGPLTRSMAQNDPKGAFEFALQQPIEEQEFPGGLVSIAPEVSILRTIAHQDIDLAIEMLPQVRTEGRASACTSLGSMLLLQGDTEQALGLVEHIPEKEQKGYYQMIATLWSSNDPKGLLDAFDEFPTSVKSRVALSMIMSNEGSNAYSEQEIANLETHISADDKKLRDRLKEIDMRNPSPEDMEFLLEFYGQ